MLDFPHTIQLETSVRCNARCMFCPSPFLHRPDMSLELAKSVVDQCVGHEVREIHPFGYADPLVWPHLIELIEYAHKVLPFTSIILYTNAGLLTAETSCEIVRVAVGAITFSIDGASSEVYESIRAGLRYQEVVDNVRTFLKLNKRGIRTRVHMTVTDSNRSQTDIVRQQWEGLVDEVTFLDVDNRGERAGAPIPGKHSGLEPTKACAQPFGGMYILSSGEVGICCVDWAPAISLGNVQEQPLKDIWNGEVAQLIRHLHATGRKTELALCAGCDRTR